MSPRQRLTRREFHVIWLRAAGAPAKQVAHELGITEATVKKLSRQAYEKLEADSLVGAMATLGWVTLPDGVSEVV